MCIFSIGSDGDTYKFDHRFRPRLAKCSLTKSQAEAGRADLEAMIGGLDTDCFVSRKKHRRDVRENTEQSETGVKGRAYATELTLPTCTLRTMKVLLAIAKLPDWDDTQIVKEHNGLAFRTRLKEAPHCTPFFGYVLIPDRKERNQGY